MVYPQPTSTAQSPQSNTPTIYFGYGSNLWLHQMRIRCPTSQYLGVARLTGYRWIINDRGYANVVQSSEDEHQQHDNSDSRKYDHVVFGLVYSLGEEDERRLDRNEGVPIAYTKELLPCDLWSSSIDHKVDTSKPPTSRRDLLVYIDRERILPDEPRKEYIYRMNQGIADAVKMGVPEQYVKDVMRKFISPEEGERRKSMEEFATKQAASFRDESGVFE
ncbi:Nn.00g021820.m01.CDS01 [Neocucurbitaria sp. VM-36]